MQPIIIYGNGAMAKVLYAYAKKNMPIAGFTVDDECIQTQTFCDLPLVPFSTVTKVFNPKQYHMLIAVGFTDMNDLRKAKYQEALAKGYQFATYIHESVIPHDDVLVEDNCIILDYVSIHPGSHIGHSTFISSNTNIGHDCKIEPLNWLNSGVAIAGGCHIASGCFFGVNAAIGQGLYIAEQTFIAANTFINENTEPGNVYLSEPGQKFKLHSKKFLKFSSAMQ